MASYSTARAIRSAPSPVRSTSTACPSSLKPRASRPAILSSSSAIRNRIDPPILAPNDESRMRCAVLTVVSCGGRTVRPTPTRRYVVNRKLALIAVVVLALAAVPAGDRDRRGRRRREQPLQGSTLDRATQAALAHTGGGTVTETETGDDGAAYSVEVELANGNQVEVDLDENFDVIGQESDDDGASDEQATTTAGRTARRAAALRRRCRGQGGSSARARRRSRRRGAACS